VTSTPTISVIVLAYGSETYLAEAVDSALNSTGSETEVVVIDNGAREAVSQLTPDDRLRVAQAPCNLGFAGGCNYGARSARGETFVFLNSDARVGPSAIATLAEAAHSPGVGIAGGLVLLADEPQRVNSAGNPVHYLGFVWAGGFGDCAPVHHEPRDITAASGAFFAVRREVWTTLGGFDEQFFAYHEDADLSLRCWQRGLAVRLYPAAMAWHHYEFSRNPDKLYLAERNRLLMVLTVYPGRLLRLILPMLLAFEIAVCCEALLEGWLGAKLRGWFWLIRNMRHVLRRRRVVQAESQVPLLDLVRLLCASVDPGSASRPAMARAANVALEANWRLIVQRLDRATI
jgi:GT2 family glycosyltransferase